MAVGISLSGELPIIPGSNGERQPTGEIQAMPSSVTVNLLAISPFLHADELARICMKNWLSLSCPICR